ncbi:MAG: glycoside hydrolase [Phycisphaerales bacterium]|nr:glycoside hydrolase [Phycisphaerales bacterium]
MASAYGEQVSYAGGDVAAKPARPRSAPRVTELRNFAIHYKNNSYCSHPREVIFDYFGGGELIVGHYCASCRYEKDADIRHYPAQERSVLLLQRTTDGGRTWRPSDDVVLFNQTMPAKKKRDFLYPEPSRRAEIDMFRPSSTLFFGRTFFEPDHKEIPVCFSLRSPDKGRTWEKTPTIVVNPDGDQVWIHRHATPVIRMPDNKTLLAAFQSSTVESPTLSGADPAIFSSVDNGISWRMLSRPIPESLGAGRFTYTSLLLAPLGDLHCYTLHIDPDDESVNGIKNAICLSVSKDGGKTWESPTPITGTRRDCWERLPVKSWNYRSPHWKGKGRYYRAPWPILLKDGRILVLFTRRRMPAGIGGVISHDGGVTWGAEFIVRSDGPGPDLGYPVGCELDDGRIFTAYYFQKEDGAGLGGTRYIAGSVFRLADPAVRLAGDTQDN